MCVCVCVCATGSQESFVHKLKQHWALYGPDLLSARASTNPHLTLKKILSGFTQDIKWEISTEQVGTVIFVTRLIEYAFVGVSHLVNHW